MTEVATASILASVATAVVIAALICCCCTAASPKSVSKICGEGCCRLDRKREEESELGNGGVITPASSNDENMNRKEYEMETVDSLQLTKSVSVVESQVELNVDETADEDNDDDDEDGYSHFKSTSVISVIENSNKTDVGSNGVVTRGASMASIGGSGSGSGSGQPGASEATTSFQDRYSMATIPRSSLARNGRTTHSLSHASEKASAGKKTQSSASSSTTKRRFWQNCLSLASSSTNNSPSGGGKAANAQSNSANSR